MSLINILVENITPEINEDDLLSAFKEFGEVVSINIVTDKGPDKRFALVVMPVQAEADQAVSKLNGQQIKGVTLSVKESPVY